jgi:metallo-beta-lactamase family protein
MIVRDAQQALTQFYGLSYERAFVVTDGVVCSFYNAGHILGSALVHLVINDHQTGKVYRLGFTGDLGRKNLPILKDPTPMPPTEYLLIESTYGNRFHESMVDAGEKLKEIVNRVLIAVENYYPGFLRGAYSGNDLSPQFALAEKGNSRYSSLCR